jgi:hypothetical protein
MESDGGPAAQSDALRDISGISQAWADDMRRLDPLLDVGARERADRAIKRLSASATKWKDAADAIERRDEFAAESLIGSAGDDLEAAMNSLLSLGVTCGQG